MSFFTALIIPAIISIVVLIGIIEKKDVYQLFIEGAKEGMKIAIKIFPTFIGIFLAITMIRESGILDFTSKMLGFLKKFNIPSEIVPLSLIRPISGSGAIAMATELMKEFGTDSKIGMLSAAIMGSSETTFYVIAVYTSSIKIKNSRKVLLPAILADIASIITAIIILT